MNKANITAIEYLEKTWREEFRGTASWDYDNVGSVGMSILSDKKQIEHAIDLLKQCSPETIEAFHNSIRELKPDELMETLKQLKLNSRDRCNMEQTVLLFLKK